MSPHEISMDFSRFDTRPSMHSNKSFTAPSPTGTWAGDLFTTSPFISRGQSLPQFPSSDMDLAFRNAQTGSSTPVIETTASQRFQANAIYTKASSSYTGDLNFGTSSTYGSNLAAEMPGDLLSTFADSMSDFFPSNFASNVSLDNLKDSHNDRPAFIPPLLTLSNMSGAGM